LKALTTAEAYDMREKEAVNLALQDYFAKLSVKLGKASLLGLLKTEHQTGSSVSATNYTSATF
jgi:hypothetical protein